jgi:NAD(P)-dependent dehydrogenase (short-subunit alcohol dehydrogenase family)
MSPRASLAADLRGRTCVVTGANSGIGLAAATALARQGARLVMLCRDPKRGEAARESIVAESGNAHVELRLVDLSHQAAVREAARRLVQDDEPIHVLVNNAGVWLHEREETPDGIERTWATNVLGYFLLTEELLPLLRRGAPARVVSVASELAGDLELDDVEFRRRRYGGITAYSQSKQADRMWTWALARRLEGSGVTANAMHPGGVNTPLLRKGGGLMGLAGAAYARAMGKTPEEGADTVVWLAASPEVEGVSGRFFIDRRDVPCRFRDREGEEALWRVCEGMIRPG